MAELYVRWFDLWIGVFYDRHNHVLYVQFLPCIGVRFPLLRSNTK